MSYYDMIQSVSIRKNDEIRKAVSPLFNCLNLCHFSYSKMTNEGHLFYIGALAPWIEYFASNRFHLVYPCFRHPKYYKDTILLCKDPEECQGKEIINARKSLFQIEQTLRITIKNEEGYEEFGFCSKSPSNQQTSLFVIEIPLIKQFIAYFKNKHRDLIRKACENSFDIKTAIGKSFYEAPDIIIPAAAKKEEFLKKLGFMPEFCLSPTEKQVLKLLIRNGYSAKQLGEAIFRSKRTIEHHLERIKGKLLCHSKAELVQKGQELESFGLLC